MCDRKFGIGADGLLLLIPSLKADFGMRMFNPDGSESEACGNGLRCLIKYIADIKLAVGNYKLKYRYYIGCKESHYALKDGKADIIQASMGILNLMLLRFRYRWINIWEKCCFKAYSRLSLNDR